MDGRGREMYRKFDGASDDAFVTVLPHDRVQLATHWLHLRVRLAVLRPQVRRYTARTGGAYCEPIDC